jgi:hypothetical protein
MNVVEGEEQEDLIDTLIPDPTTAIHATKEKAIGKKVKEKLTANQMESAPKRAPAIIVAKRGTKQGNAEKESMMKSRRRQRRRTQTMPNILPSMKLL